ncbi:MAG: hypothetical protein O3C60_06555 [Planctomycetota bacterium]|nr:hypothetical protein [Planctomycetota bacterium]
MSKKLRKKFRNDKQLQDSLPEESPSVEAITVAWLVSCIFTLTGNLGLIVMGTLLAFGVRSERILILAQLILLASLLCGLISLVLSILVQRLRRHSPPQGMVAAAVVSSLVPFAIYLAVLMQVPAR